VIISFFIPGQVCYSWSSPLHSTCDIYFIQSPKDSYQMSEGFRTLHTSQTINTRMYNFVAAPFVGSAPPCCPSYTVAPGDTATSVAAAQSVTPKLLTSFNSLPDGATLTPGQSIQIPCARVLTAISKGLAAKQASAGSPSPSPHPSG
jgi:LysM repeat protein